MANIDSEAGYPSRETGIDPILKKRGSNQLVGSRSHDDDPTKIWTSDSNSVQTGSLPKWLSSPVGAPNAINPAGSPEESLEP